MNEQYKIRQPRVRNLAVRITEREHEALHLAAAREDRTVAEVVRDAVRREVRRINTLNVK